MTTLFDDKKCYSDQWYVFWVKTGQEERATDEIRVAFVDDAAPFQLAVETIFRKKGMVKKEIHPAFPGYVFVETSIKEDVFIRRASECVRKTRSILRLLCYGDVNRAAMRNVERMVIESLWRDNKCVEVSSGFIEGDHIIIVDGPLVGFESVIKEIHPRRRQAIIELEFMGDIRRITVGFDIIEKCS